VGCGQKAERGVEVFAIDGDVIRLVGADGVLHAKHRGPRAEIGDVGAGHAVLSE